MLLHYSKKCAANAKRSIHIATNAHSLWGWGLRSSLPPVRENAQSIVRPIQISGLTPEHVCNMVMTLKNRKSIKSLTLFMFKGRKDSFLGSWMGA
jgi:hypothetical protein